MDRDALTATLEEQRATLAGWQQSIHRAMADPVVGEWLALDNDNLLAGLAVFGIKDDCNKVRKRLPQAAKAITGQIAGLDNEAGRILTELRTGQRPPEEMAADATRLAGGITSLRKALATFQAAVRLLTESENTLRSKLNQATLLRAAHQAAEDGGDFRAGADVLLAVAGDGEHHNSQLDDLLARAGHLLGRLKEVDYPEGLPAMVTGILGQYLDAVEGALTTVRDQLLDLQKRTVDVVDAADAAENRLTELRGLPLAQRLAGFHDLAARFAATVAGFAKFQPRVQRLLAAGETIIRDGKRFLDGCPALLADLQKTVAGNDGLNPAALARREAAGFFAGLGGILRMVRLLGSSLTGARMVTEPELQRLLETLLSQCRPMGRRGTAANGGCHHLLASLLEPYRRPFPHDDLQRLGRRLMHAYNFAVDKHLAALPLAAGDDGEPVPLGKLVGRIEARAGALEDD